MFQLLNTFSRLNDVLITMHLHPSVLLPHAIQPCMPSPAISRPPLPMHGITALASRMFCDRYSFNRKYYLYYYIIQEFRRFLRASMRSRTSTYASLARVCVYIKIQDMQQKY
jgi:hypothetical protein